MAQYGLNRFKKRLKPVGGAFIEVAQTSLSHFSKASQTDTSHFYKNGSS
jgi:hypothetical protein